MCERVATRTRAMSLRFDERARPTADGSRLVSWSHALPDLSKCTIGMPANLDTSSLSGAPSKKARHDNPPVGTFTVHTGPCKGTYEDVVAFLDLTPTFLFGIRLLKPKLRNVRMLLVVTPPTQDILPPEEWLDFGPNARIVWLDRAPTYATSESTVTNREGALDQAREFLKDAKTPFALELSDDPLWLTGLPLTSFDAAAGHISTGAVTEPMKRFLSFQLDYEQLNRVVLLKKKEGTESTERFSPLFDGSTRYYFVDNWARKDVEGRVVEDRLDRVVLLPTEEPLLSALFEEGTVKEFVKQWNTIRYQALATEVRACHKKTLGVAAAPFGFILSLSFRLIALFFSFPLSLSACSPLPPPSSLFCFPLPVVTVRVPCR